MASTTQKTDIIANCPDETPEARAYATMAWKLADCERHSSRFGSMAEVIMSEIHLKIEEPGSKVTEKDEIAFYDWVETARRTRAGWETDAKDFQKELKAATKVYHESRNKAKLPILQVEYFFEVNLDSKRILVGKDFDINRAAFVLSSTKEYFETFIKPTEWEPTGKLYMNCDSAFPDYLSYKAEEEAYREEVAKTPGRIRPYFEYLPGNIARLAGMRRDGQPIDLKGPMLNPVSRQLVFRVYLTAKEQQLQKKRKDQQQPNLPGLANAAGRNLETPESGTNKRQRVDQELEGSEEDPDIMEEAEGIELDEQIASGDATMKEAHVEEQEAQRGDTNQTVKLDEAKASKPTASAPHAPATPQTTPKVPPPPRVIQTTPSSRLEAGRLPDYAFSVPYTPRPQASHGLYHSTRGTPPQKADGTFVTDVEWKRIYDNANARLIAKYKGYEKAWLRDRGFVRSDAIRYLKEKGIMAAEQVDGPAEW